MKLIIKLTLKDNTTALRQHTISDVAKGNLKLALELVKSDYTLFLQGKGNDLKIIGRVDTEPSSITKRFKEDALDAMDYGE